MARSVCVHGHFYQPLREDPWLEAIEVQDSAHPFHDWNERISAECYAPNAAARILDNDGFILRLVNNYAQMSFDFGPTLLAWLQRHAAPVYRAILEADRESCRRLGHGAAIAQCYSHLIMPLANAADKLTQIQWALADFEHHFQRPAAGIWLPETAVDLPTLDFLAGAGLQFVLLAPQQAARYRALGQPHWLEIGPGGLDTTMPYQIGLPSGRRIASFFFHPELSQAVAFDKSLLNNGELLARRIREACPSGPAHAPLVGVVTDGETFGHHHRRGEMALAYALQCLQADPSVQLTNFTAHLHRHPPTHEVQIHEQTAWSCPHGLGRWRADCGCSNRRQPHWTQQWRAPLRTALDWLHAALTPAWFKAARRLLKDPWAARNDYIHVLLDRRQAAAFLARHAIGELSAAQQTSVWKLLELQRHALLMFTSCGWFHDEVTGIETQQNLKHAARAIQLARELCGDSVQPRFVELLHAAKSNLPEYHDAGWVYENWIRPATWDWPHLAAHYAARRLFEDDGPTSRFYSYQFSHERVVRHEQDQALMITGRALCRARRTEETVAVWFAAVNHGQFQLQFAGGMAGAERQFHALRRQLAALFHRGQQPELEALLRANFSLVCGPDGLFRDEQRRLSHELLRPVLAEAEDYHRAFYQRHASLLRFLGGIGAPAPAPLQMAANIAWHRDWNRAFDARGHLSAERLAQLLAQARAARVRIEPHLFGATLGRLIAGELRALRLASGGLQELARAEQWLRLAADLPEADLSEAQEVYAELQRLLLAERQALALIDPTARDWVGRFQALATLLRIRHGHPPQLDLAANG